MPAPERLIYVYNNDEIEMQFDGVLDRSSFRAVTRRLYGHPPLSILSLDLEHVTYAYATAVVPLISLVRHLGAQGTQVEIIYPFEDSYWATAGWKQLLQEKESPAIDPGKSFIPVQAYSDSAHLNVIISAVIDVLSRHMVCSSGVLD